jgi:hypothetical protein
MTTGSSSNDNGRSLEYLITAELLKKTGCSLTQRAVQFQSRDASTVTQISQTLRSSFVKAAKTSADWIVEEIGGNTGIAFKVDRASDGDVGAADLVVASKNKNLLISVKHNHDALSHPRPYSLVEAVGFRGTRFESDHRDRMSNVSDRFRKASNNATSYGAAPAAKLQLYYDVCDECSTSLGRIAKGAKTVEQIFNFIVSPGCKKLVVRTDSTSKALSGIEVFDYTQIIPPTKLATRVDRRSKAASLILDFNNGWRIDMRLHTASSRVSTSGQLSLKFDAQRELGVLPPVITLM